MPELETDEVVIPHGASPARKPPTPAARQISAWREAGGWREPCHVGPVRNLG